MYHLAVDIGASSGRHMVWDGERLTEVYRFPNGTKMENGHLIWDTQDLLSQVTIGIEKALAQFPIKSFAIDTWGVDYVLLQGEKELAPCYAYRDSRTEPIIDAVHEKIPFAELYRRTGCQFQPFNTVYQLCDDLHCGRLTGVTDLLMLPEYLLYRLTGVKVREFTNATTTGLVNVKTKEFDREIIEALGLPGHLFPALTQPGAVIGQYRGIDAVLCATHDTASAVEGIEMEEDGLYLSSGTWSLLGVKLDAALTDESSMQDNFSNEGGVGYCRYQKNIMGLWIVQQLQKELCPNKDFPTIVREARESRFEVTVDADDPKFLAPKSMATLFAEVGAKEERDCFRCAFRSLARSYAKAVEQIERNTKKTYRSLTITGGGAKNDFLNELTAEATGKTVVAMPIEATAMGNIKVQRSVYHDKV
ncbi:MAG: rhamnulokinase [Oscillospiraceae bacterium]|nr:rhamnulokinase [Oscillospiraceae bacterium]